jgi:hypothetical protein
MIPTTTSSTGVRHDGLAAADNLAGPDCAGSHQRNPESAVRQVAAENDEAVRLPVVPR